MTALRAMTSKKGRFAAFFLDDSLR